MANLLLLLVTSLCVEVCHSQAAPVNWGLDPHFKNHWPDPYNASLDIVVSLPDCAAVCSSRPWCSSFFYLPPTTRCLVLEGLYVDRQVLRTREGAEYYRLVSDSCPIQNCYFLSRPDNLCFHLDLSFSGARKNYSQSKTFCKDNGGQLAILDTLSKNQWIANVLKMHKPSGTSLFLGAQRRGSGFAWSNDQAVAAQGSKEGFWRTTEDVTALGDSIMIQLTADGLTPSCLPGEVELNDVCVWSPLTATSDLSDTFSQCAQQGGQPFTFTSFELLNNARTPLSVESVELFVPAIKNNYTYRWLSAANSSNTASAAFFSDDVINSDVTGKDCVTVMKSNFTAQDCISDFRFICSRELNSTWNSTCALTQRAPGSACASPTSSSAMTTQQATANPLTGADNSSSPCVPQDDGSCVPFDELLIGVLGSLKEGALDDLLNDTGTDLGDVMHGRQTLPDDHHTVLSVINMLKASRNRTDVTQQVIKDLDVSNMTHQEAGSAMEAIYDLLVADNSTEEGGDDRVASLLFKMAYVSSVDRDMLTTFAKSTALVLYGEGHKPQKKDKKKMQAVRVLQSMERILTTSNVSSLQQNLDQLVMSVVDVNMTQSSDDVTLNVKVGDAANVMRLSCSLFPSDEGKVSSVVYTDIHHLLPSNRQGSLKGGVVNSHVISLVVHNGIECSGHYFLTSGTGTGIHTDEHDFHDHLDFTVNFTLPRLNAGRPGMDEQRWCVHWKFHSGAWSEDGCWLLEHNLTHTTCTCNHLSTFAVLVTFTKPAQISAENERGMFVLTAIGCSLSIAGLTFTLLTYIYLRILHRERILIHASLALSLLLAQVLFISSDHARDNEVACKIVAALLHFLFMAAFSWMLVEGMALYRTCTRGLLYSSDMRLKYSIIGWGLPLIVVVISLGVEFPNYGRGLQNSCWLSVNKGLIWAFLAPMLVIVSLNVLILCLVIRVFLTLRANSQKTETARARAGLRAMLMLLPLLGTTWLLSLLVPLSSVCGYLFIVCNSLQGLMIFVLHCLSNEEVRRFLAMKRGGSRSRTSESNLSVIGWRRRSPALTFDDVKVRIPQRGHGAQNEGRKTAWV